MNIEKDQKITNINIDHILKILPHRYPFLLVDKMIEVIPGKSAIGLKNVTMNEPHFTGHFPDMPVMPGVLIIEAMAQVSAVLVGMTMAHTKESKDVFFMSIDSAKFRQIVKPGDSIYIHTKIDKNRGEIWKFSAEAFVDNIKVAESSFMAMVRDKK